ARQMIAGRRKRIVHPLQYREGGTILEGIDNLPRGERPEAADVEAAHRDALLLAHVIDGCLARLHVAAHADDYELGVFAAIRLDEVVLATRLFIEELKRLFQGRTDTVVI